MPKFYSKSQNAKKLKWDGAEEPTINNFDNIDNRNFECLIVLFESPTKFPNTIFTHLVIYTSHQNYGIHTSWTPFYSYY